MARTIVAGYDGSECAKSALSTAVDLAREVPGSRIIVVCAHDVNLSVGGGPMAAEAIIPDLLEPEPPLDPRVHNLLEDAIATVTAAGVEAESVFERKRPVDALLDAAEAFNADMIVVGTHGSGAIRGVLLGSTPFKLLHHSHVPVVVVPHKK
jgi:nucleotide-binding universal stress UspA family protein